MKKDVIYVDVEDEITEVTSKVIDAKGKIVALVLPKKCNLLHSSVNMKILIKTAKANNKNLVLITSEKALLPIAGANGLFVAKTLQSKPAVPDFKPELAEANEPELIGDEPVIDETKSIGELSGEESVDEDSPIELGDDPAVEPADEIKTEEKEKKNKKLKVPNFDSFRIKLFLGIFAIIFIGVAWYMGTAVLPRAIVTITTESKTIPIAVDVTAKKGATSDDIASKTFILQTKTIEKTESKKAPATGTKNNGTKATGKVTLTNCESTDAITVPAGTTLTASGPSGYVFLTDVAVTVPGSGFSGGGTVCNGVGKADVNVTASQPGGNYNVSARSYTVSGVGKVTGFGGNMGGGTDNNVKVVSEEDCTTLKNDLLNTKSDDYKTQLVAQFETAGLAASKETFTVETVKVGCEPPVGTEAAEFTASATFKYTMSGVNSASLNQLIQQEALALAGPGQAVTDTGLSKASITVKERKSNGDIIFMVQTESQTGLKQDSVKITDSIKGKNARQTAETIKGLPGVKDVKVEYKPFWVSKTPTNVKHVKIVFVNGNATK